MNCKTLGLKDMPGKVWGIQQSADVYEYVSLHIKYRHIFGTRSDILTCPAHPDRTMQYNILIWAHQRSHNERIAAWQKPWLDGKC